MPRHLCNNDVVCIVSAQIGQLLAMFQVLGTPTEEQWPGVSSLPHWQALFPQWPPLGLAQARAPKP